MEFKIKDYVFSDVDITGVNVCSNSVEISLSYEVDYIFIGKDDAIALAKHFKLIEE